MFGLFIIIAIISGIVSIAIGSHSSGKVNDVISELDRSHSRRWQISSDYSKALSDLKKLMNDNASRSEVQKKLNELYRLEQDFQQETRHWTSLINEANHAGFQRTAVQNVFLGGANDLSSLFYYRKINQLHNACNTSVTLYTDNSLVAKAIEYIKNGPELQAASNLQLENKTSYSQEITAQPQTEDKAPEPQPTPAAVTEAAPSYNNPPKKRHRFLVSFAAILFGAGALIAALYVASPSSYRKYIGDPVNSLLVKTGIEKAVPKSKKTWPADQIVLPAHAEETETLSDDKEPDKEENREETSSGTYTAEYLESAEGIKMTQRLLAQAGYDYIVDDGKVGPKTRQAVSDFRVTAGLPDSENIDQELILALQEYVDNPQEQTQTVSEPSTEYMGMTVSAEMIGTNQVKLTFDNNTSTEFTIGGWGMPHEACLKTTAGEYWTKVGTDLDDASWGGISYGDVKSLYESNFGDFNWGYRISTHSSDEITLSFDDVQGEAVALTIHEISSLVDGLPTFGKASDVTISF